MTDNATLAAPAGASRSAVTLGSFALGVRQSEEQRRLNGVALFAARGRDETALAGVEGFAYCAPVPENDPSAVARIAEQLVAARSLAFDAIVPILEADLAGRVAYVIEEAPSGERLSGWLARNRQATPWIVSNLIGDLAAALQVAHDTGINHGMLVPPVAWLDHEGKCKLGGFGLAVKSESQDRRQLALLTIELLAGKPFDPEVARGLSLPLIGERVRTHVSGLTERVALVIARGLHPDPAIGFGSVAEYAVALRSEIVTAATDIAAGAWQALSLKDTAMATVLINKMADYDPASPELPLLRVRMNDEVMIDPGSATALFVERKALELDEPTADPLAATLMPISGELESEDHKAAVKALLTPPPPAVDLSMPKSNPWYILVIGICVMLIIFTVLTALTVMGP